MVRALVLMWGACLLYFATASSLGGLTTPREVLTRLLLVGGIASLALFGLLLVVWRSERIAAWLVFTLATLLALVMIVSSVISAAALMRSSQPILDPWALLGVDLLNVVVFVGPPVVTGWLLRASARTATAQARGESPPRALALRVGLVLFALSLAAVLWLVISNMLWVADHDPTWLLWINFAFLVLLAGVLGWQFWEAWSRQAGSDGVLT